MKKTVMLISCFALAVALTACGGQKKAENPDDVFANLQDASKKKDFGAMYDMLSKKAQDSAEEIRKGIVTKADAGWAALSDEQKAEANEKMKKELGIDSFDALKKMAARDFFEKVAGTNPDKVGAGLLAKFEKAEVTKCAMNEDKKTATLEFKDHEGKEYKETLVLEEGNWKLDYKLEGGGFKLGDLIPSGLGL